MEELIRNRVVWKAVAKKEQKAAKKKMRSCILRRDLVPGIFLFAAALVIGTMLALHGAGKLLHSGFPGYSRILQEDVSLAPARGQGMGREERVSLGIQIGDAVGADYSLIAQAGQRTFFLDTNSEKGVHLLILSARSGNCGYWSAKPMLTPWTDADRHAIEEALRAFQIEIPDSARFAQEGNGWHSFSQIRREAEDTITSGTLRCRYAKDGTIRALKSSIQYYIVEQTQ